MICSVTVRLLKPDSFDAFRAAWEPRPWPPELRRVVIARNDQEPDQVLTASFLDVDPDRLEAMRDDAEILGAEERRLHRIAEFEQATVFKGLFNVTEELTAASG
jgi:hypothetical protein